MTLVEVVVSISLLGVVIVTILGGLGTAVTSSAQHRHLATADTLLRSAAEIVSAPATAYVACASTTSYGASLPTDPNGTVVLTITKVEQWNGNPSSPAFSTACSTDSGIQLITYQARSNDNKHTDTVQAIKRRTT
jgi:type II secretory pathway pseudopilin PulG